MQIIVNGQSRTENQPLSVAALLGALSLDHRRLAVELNRQILPRAKYEQTTLNEGDQLEIVTLVGGG